MLRSIRLLLAYGLGLLLLSVQGVLAADLGSLELSLRSRTQEDGRSAVVVHKAAAWQPEKTAIVICDMWDDHYCQNAARRVGELAPRMNEVIRAARQRGVLIIHCPSGCMDVYKDTPQRKLAQQAPPVETKIPLENWCYLDKGREGEMPVDTTQPCDDENLRERVRFYNRQIETLKIEPGDAITDSAEAYYLMRQRGIENVILMGVHTNMCVLGRPFGVRQLVYQGMNVALVRDMTDAMYSPTMKPYVSHVRGTELVIEHIEQHWCSTITSTDILGTPAFRFSDDKRPRVVMAAGSSYQAEESLPQLAHLLRDRHNCDCQVLTGRGEGKDYNIAGLEKLEDADALVLFLRRRALPRAQMSAVRDYIQSGKPVLAIRTASHGFDVAEVPKGRAEWADFDQQVLGAQYLGDANNKYGTDVTAAADAEHPILAGLSEEPWQSKTSLYRFAKPSGDVQILLQGRFAGGKEVQPLAWVRQSSDQRIFYTSLGGAEDFQDARFQRLLVNALFWSMKKEPARQ